MDQEVGAWDFRRGHQGCPMLALIIVWFRLKHILASANFRILVLIYFLQINFR